MGRVGGREMQEGREMGKKKKQLGGRKVGADVNSLLF